MKNVFSKVVLGVVAISAALGVSAVVAPTASAATASTNVAHYCILGHNGVIWGCPPCRGPIFTNYACPMI